MKRKPVWLTVDGLRLRVGSVAYKWFEKNRKRLTSLFKKPTRRPAPVVMYDSVDVEEIPAKAKVVAGYVGGKWPTFPVLVKRFPRAHKLSIAITASEDADCLDIEKGDATIPQAPAWVTRQHKRLARPVVYTSLSEAQQLVDTLAKAGVGRDEYRLWTAHYTGKPHLCAAGGCGFGFRGRADATQYTDRALRRNLDASLCSPGFFG